jgi:hypothetical protein
MKTIMARMKHCALTASNWSKAVGFVALNAALLFTTGCASTGKVEPIAQRLPRGSSCVALVSISTKRQLTAGEPSTLYSPMKEGARVFAGFGDPAEKLLAGAMSAGSLEGATLALAAAVAWLPPSALIGSAYGAATGVPDSEIQTAIQSASKFVTHYDFEAELIRKVSDMSWTDHQIGLNSFVATGSEQIFGSLSQRGFRHVIEMEMGPVLLDGDYELRNPRLSLKVDVTAKLYRLHGSRREEVHLIQVRYRGDKQRFVRWMAEDAKALRAEVDKCQRTVAAQILEAFAE